MEVTMFRQNMGNIPQYPLPDGYAMRPYQSGDIQHWLDFHIPLFDKGDITEALFWREYGRDEALLAQRQYYMTHGETVMGSISAWFGDEARGTELGRVHWVVLREDYRGKGLAKPLMSFVLNRLKALGHTQAYLDSDSALIPALSLYLQFGFEPEITHAQDKQIWDDVYRQLGK